MAALRFALFCLCVASVAACTPAAPEAAPQPLPEAGSNEKAADSTPSVDASAVVEHTPAAGIAVADTKALAGKYGDGESVLELRADGSYLQTLQVGGSSITADGSWSASGEKALLLDPSSKAAEDARFDIVSNDELRAADGARTFKRISGQ